MVLPHEEVAAHAATSALRIDRSQRLALELGDPRLQPRVLVAQPLIRGVLRAFQLVRAAIRASAASKSSR